VTPSNDPPRGEVFESMSTEAAGINLSETACVELSCDELTILIGGVHEALFELGDEEFAIRVGPPADEARQLIERLAVTRKIMKNQKP